MATWEGTHKNSMVFLVLIRKLICHLNYNTFPLLNCPIPIQQGGGVGLYKKNYFTGIIPRPCIIVEIL